MSQFNSVKELDLENKRVLVRVDFNVPFDVNGNISDDTRIQAALPTIRHLLDQNAQIILASHLGRPNGKKNPKLSLQPVASVLAKLLEQPVTFCNDCVGPEVKAAVASMQPGSIILLENLRFHSGEESNGSHFSQLLANLAEAYINDAFGTVHRAHASTVGVPQRIPLKGAGFLIEKEVQHLSQQVDNPALPFTVILGGAKVSDKINVINAFLEKASTILIGGAMTYTFALAQNEKVGSSLTEPDKVSVAKDCLKRAKEKGVQILLPVDHLIADSIDFENGVLGITKVVEGDIPEGWHGVDIGPKTLEHFASEIDCAQTLLWNGPMGIFEIDAASKGTCAVAKFVATSAATSIIGGGDSIKALRQSGYADDVTFISTGGGATLEFLEGKKLPGLTALMS